MDMKKIIAILNKKGYTVSSFDKAADATEYLNSEIDNMSVGFGDSLTLMQMDLYGKLTTHNDVFDPMHCREGSDFLDTAKSCLASDVFLTSVNALAATGEMVNIDGSGNRVAGSLFGHKKVYFVLGTNKLEPTLDKAVWRARNVAGPKNARRLQLNTPCAVNGDRCYDCDSPDRICNGMLIHFRKMSDVEMEIVLINESLGY